MFETSKITPSDSQYKFLLILCCWQWSKRHSFNVIAGQLHQLINCGHPRAHEIMPALRKFHVVKAVD
jgi:hypothetical protein